MIRFIDGGDGATVESVGGKGFSLLRAARAGMRVPEFCILDTEFFAPWLEELRKQESWKGLSSREPEAAKLSCRALKERAREFALEPERKRLLLQAIERTFGGERPQMAVRSSSPEEDARGSSFAGAYESLLGITEAHLESSIRDVFSSCLDERIVVYKLERGYDPADAKIAVVVQRLLNADRSGVAFSANPLTNDLDEVLINASFGLGESIVSGSVTPDTYVYDRARNRVAEKSIGKKETGIFFKTEGGTERRTIEAPRVETLGEGEAAEIAGLCDKAAEMLGRPADIEWAYEGSALYLLQARPVTTLFALPPSILSPPGGRRRLYADFTLVAQGMQRPMSVLGIDFYGMIQRGSTMSLLGLDLQDLDEGFFGNVEGRVFMNVSNVLRAPGGMANVMRFCRGDPLVQAVMHGLPPGAYANPRKPEKLRFFVVKLLGHAIGYSKKAREAYRDPRAYKARFVDECRKRFEELKGIEEKTPGMKELARAFAEWFSDFLADLSLAMTTASHSMALQSIKRTFASRGGREAEILELERGLPDNITTSMGLDLEKLVAFASFRDYASYGEWRAACGTGEVPEECRSAFDGYLEAYGFRGPGELDLRTARPSDDPAAFYATLRERAIREEGRGAGRAQYERAGKEREEAFDSLRDSLPEGKARENFKKDYTAWVTLGGYREIHKYYLVSAIHRLRSKALAAGRKLADEGRLDSPDDIFDLTLGQIDDAIDDPKLDLRALAETNTAWSRANWAGLREFPGVFDSRGRILRPVRTEAADGEYRGQGISPGIAEGRVKVLHSAGEKPLLAGEILVARATDPGWTPLFVPAAAIILEIGGPMQHGAVVAREYGKPCIAGIEGVTELFKDGDLVRVDGASGIARIVARSS